MLAKTQKIIASSEVNVHFHQQFTNALTCFSVKKHEPNQELQGFPVFSLTRNFRTVFQKSNFKVRRRSQLHVAQNTVIQFSAEAGLNSQYSYSGTLRNVAVSRHDAISIFLLVNACVSSSNSVLKTDIREAKALEAFALKQTKAPDR
jgi:hypothetical protein